MQRKRTKQPRPQVIHDIYNVSITDIMRMAGSKQRADDNMRALKTKYKFKIADEKARAATEFNRGVGQVFGDTLLLGAEWQAGDLRLYANTKGGEVLRVVDIYDKMHGDGAFAALDDAAKTAARTRLNNNITRSAKIERNRNLGQFKDIIRQSADAGRVISKAEFDNLSIADYDYKLSKAIPYYDGDTRTDIMVSLPLEFDQLITKYGPHAHGITLSKDDVKDYLHYKHAGLTYDRYAKTVGDMMAGNRVDLDKLFPKITAHGKRTIYTPNKAKSVNLNATAAVVLTDGTLSSYQTPSTVTPRKTEWGDIMGGFTPNVYASTGGVARQKKARMKRLALSAPSALEPTTPRSETRRSSSSVQSGIRASVEGVARVLDFSSPGIHSPVGGGSDQSYQDYDDVMSDYGSVTSELSLDNFERTPPSPPKKKSTRRISAGIKSLMSKFEPDTPPLELVGSPSPVKIGRTMTLREWRNTPPSSGMNLMERKSTPKKKTPTPG